MIAELARADAGLEGGNPRRAQARLRLAFEREPSLPLARAIIERAERLAAARPSREPRRARFLRSFTVEPFFPLLRAGALVHGLDLRPEAGPFNAYAQEILDPGSALYRSDPDLVFLAIQTRDLLPALWDGPADLALAEAARLADEALESLGSWVRTLRSRSRATVVVLDFALPPRPAAGALDAQAPAGQTGTLERLNRGLRELAASERGVFVLPFEALVARVGRDAFFDERKWLTARMPIAAGALWPLARECLRIALPATGCVHKVVVTDLDNTLWGGIVGEDGPKGLRLGTEYPGAAFLELQRALLDLRRRGVLLAVASKNNEADAMEVLSGHPAMLLRPEHFAALRIGWDDKADSLLSIARELELGTDSLVFLDDNPVERENVRSRLPEVHVLELPSDPMGYARAVRDLPTLERVSLSAEDRERGRLYQEQRARADLRRSAASLEEFYASLEMRVAVAPLTPETVARVAQLTQKTNQFNLTTRRRDEAWVAALLGDPGWRSYACSVRDRFGDNGLVGVALVRCGEAAWEIDNFLLSCRVIGRTVETGLAALVAADARSAGARQLRGWFLPTPKNEPARDFYRSHGFRVVEERAEGTLWELDLAGPVPEWPAWLGPRPAVAEETT